MTYRLVTVLITALSISACSLNPMRSDYQLTGTAEGTATGAVTAGATAWALHGKSWIAPAAIIGGTLGYYTSTLRFASGGVMQAGGVVYTLGDFATIEIPSDKLFDVNTTDFLPEAGPILDSSVAVLNRYPKNNIMVSGNTSGYANNKYERKLSEQRAGKVAAYLWAHGVNGFQGASTDMRKLTYVGYGNYFPIANDIHAQSIRANSRIQITAYPSKAQLHLDKKHKVFHNIGGLNEPRPEKENKVDVDSAFNDGDQLLDRQHPPRDDFGMIPATGHISSAPQEKEEGIPEEFKIHGEANKPEYNSADTKGEKWLDQNSIDKEFQTTEGDKVEKHGGAKVDLKGESALNFKGEGGYKDESPR